MSDDSPSRLQQQKDLPPAKISVPELPSDSGAWFGSRASIVRADTDFVEAHTDFLEARRAQTDAMTKLIEARIRAAHVMGQLIDTPAAVQHVNRMAQLDRAHQLRMKVLAQAIEASGAEAALVKARGHLPQQPQASTLTIEDVEALVQSLPDVAPETAHTLGMLLRAKLKE